MKSRTAIQSYARHSDFSETTFWRTLKACARRIGRVLLYTALCLYYAMQNPAMPLPLKLSIMASLAYLVCPVDAIPDVIPVLGYSDDVGVLGATTTAVAAYIDADVTARASHKADEILA
ncbi:MAG: DUF1232 domain-containing protein [Desulfovibrio sp.]|nr:DUF1232 domain-containing protein [Desulfovibrio sp.]